MGKDSSRKQQDRRTGNDRRRFTFTLHIPERRSGDDRRAPDGQKKKSKTSSKNSSDQSDDSELSEKS